MQKIIISHGKRFYICVKLKHLSDYLLDNQKNIDKK